MISFYSLIMLRGCQPELGIELGVVVVGEDIDVGELLNGETEHLGERADHQRCLRFNVNKADRSNDRRAIRALNLQRPRVFRVEQAQGLVGSHTVDPLHRSSDGDGHIRGCLPQIAKAHLHVVGDIVVGGEEVV